MMDDRVGVYGISLYQMARSHRYALVSRASLWPLGNEQKSRCILRRGTRHGWSPMLANPRGSDVVS